MGIPKAFTTIYLAVGGWQSVLVSWESIPDHPDGGMMTPWQTGFGPYGHTEEAREMAANEAQSWANDEEVEYVESNEKTCC